MTRAPHYWLLCATLAFAGCDSELDNAGGSGVDAGVDDDPLTAIDPGPDDGSLDHIHRTIIKQRCAGQPGLCHAGQFEPNLSTPAMTYNYMVNMPSIEKRGDLRVAPGSPGASVLIDKLRDRDVASQMPLGAEPLAEDEIVMIEDWIRDGALRRPGADPAPELNHTPASPEIAVFQGGERRDLAGPFVMPIGQPFTLRMSVEDFEVDDADIPFALFFMQAPDGRQVVVRPGEMDPGLAVATFDATAPEGAGDLLNWEFTATIHSMVDLVDDMGNVESVASSGMTFSVVAIYIDGPFNASDTMAAFAVGANLFTME